MREVVQIGELRLSSPLFIRNDYEIKVVETAAYKTLGGSTIVFEHSRRNGFDIELDSFDNRWLTEGDLRILWLMANDIGRSYVVVTKNGEQMKCRFKNEETPIKAEPLFEGSEWYKVNIKLSVVE